MHKFKTFIENHKQQFPMFASLIAVLFSTAFLDFNIGTYKFKSHMSILVNLVDKPSNNVAGLYLFSLVLLSLVILVNTFNYKKTRSLFSTIFTTILTVLQVVMTYVYLNVFIQEMAARPTIKFDGAMATALVTITLSALFSALATVFCWVSVDYHYKKKVE